MFTKVDATSDFLLTLGHTPTYSFIFASIFIMISHFDVIIADNLVYFCCEFGINQVSKRRLN